MSSKVLDLVSIETSCGVEKATRLPGIVAHKIVHIPIGFPQGLIEPRRYEDSTRDPVILCVARIARMKGQDVLVTAFAPLAARYPAWSVRLIGPVSEPAFHKELVELVQTKSLQSQVSFVGLVGESELDREYDRASIFCLPSVYSENAGQVKYEATACGLPVVTSEVPCGRDDIEMGWQVVRPGDPNDLASKLDELMRDEGLRRRRADSAQSRQRSYLDVAQSYLEADR